MGSRNNPEVIVTVVCIRLGQNPTSIVIYAISPDESAASSAANHIRDQIKSAVSPENDVVLNPVPE